jgi:hypothetical protein
MIGRSGRPRPRAASGPAARAASDEHATTTEQENA